MTIYNHPAKEKVERRIFPLRRRPRENTRKLFYSNFEVKTPTRKHVYIKCDDVIISVLCY